ncbi:energy-coupling factor ABC transporter ATP-binding protein [Thermofilum pendens]|uniref:ABC transporter related n=1 Tax=Thermofilum pendens (strain DSM 2475 / Hrk 5) TaxID=368408 RepID=A1S107_THEPD|nr:ABC transporter ATP-binding protein [Thermofilum pendens]ABL79137.1 ABC transporter related [Thermofilum pendens Hrk 5]
MLECRDLWAGYPGFGDVLRGVTLGLERGEVVALLGPNGSGKTTLLLALAGLLKPSRGSVLLDGRDLWSQLPGARRRIGLVFQDPDDQLFNPTVEEELAFALNQLGLPEAEKASRLERAARMLGVEGLLDRPVHALSYGEKRRVALASVLVYDPEYLLLDEPTANLDPRSASALLEAVCRLKREGRGVLLATQDVGVASRVADRYAVIHGGRIAWEGAELPREVLEKHGLTVADVSCREL